MDSDVDLSIADREAAVRSFLQAAQQGRRREWLTDFYGESVPQSRFDAKDEADVIEDILSRQDSWTRLVFRCPECGRMYVERAPKTGEYRCYGEE